MSDIQDREVREFLSTGTKTGHIGYLASDGRPLAVPVWFVVDGGSIAFNTGGSSAKARAMTRDSRVVLTVDLPEPPYAFVQVQGIAEISDDLDDVRRIAQACGARYMGADRGQEFADRNGVPGEIVVRVRPTKVIASLNATA